ncbi:spondin domain-containing protein [Aurantibacter sp.]|uniref:T9SS type A sorting domain-containing protein n=1 Tax=Aurantibacter sp. TaxID=2807103 RepID=UPI0035C7A23E
MRNFTFFLTLITFCAQNPVNAQTSAIYDITFTSTWNASEHESIPPSAHWSSLVGGVHSSENAYLETGTLASTGVKNVAELGAKTEFENEVTSNTTTKEWLNKQILGYNQSTLISDIEFTTEFHYLTLISMIAPSPDWFVSINSLNLRNDTNTAWKTTFTIDVFMYDAGTDSGNTYTASNMPNSPTVITKITSSPFNGNKIGTLTLTQKSLSTSDFETQENEVNSFPNPITNGKVTLSVSGNSTVNSIEIYSILGRQIKTLQINSSKTSVLDVSDLKLGIYLFKINTVNGTTITKKLIIK